jgi:uncharacterized protein (TIGR02391 family)
MWRSFGLHGGTYQMKAGKADPTIPHLTFPEVESPEGRPDQSSARGEGRRDAARHCLMGTKTARRGILMPGLIDFAPTADKLLEIEPEELGLILLQLVNDLHSPAPRFTVSQFDTPLWNANSLGYPYHRRQVVARALAEAWQWLLTQGLIMPDPDQPNGYFCFTRRGARLQSAADIEAYRKADLLPLGNLHPVLLEKVRPMFLRGDYDLATFEAFKQVEIRVRQVASLPANLVGVDLMRAAFRPQTGPLTDKATVTAEQEALGHLFAGAIGHAKNPGSHRAVTVSAVEAASLIGFASYLLGVVESRSVP